MSWYWIGKYLAIGPLLRVFFPTEVIGRENIPLKGGCILAGNHISVADSFVTPVHITRRVTYLAKEEYFTGKGIRGWLKKRFFTAIGQVPINRNSGRAALDAIETGVKLLREGKILGIYPEGTRSRDGKLHKGKLGMARMALKAGVPIVPIATIGTNRINPVGSKLWRPGRVTIIIGEPIDTSRYSGMAGNAAIQRALTAEVMYAIMRLSGQDYVDTYSEMNAA